MPKHRASPILTFRSLLPRRREGAASGVSGCREFESEIVGRSVVRVAGVAFVCLHTAEQGARANDLRCHVSCYRRIHRRQITDCLTYCCTSRASEGRGSSVTLAKMSRSEHWWSEIKPLSDATFCIQFFWQTASSSRFHGGFIIPSRIARTLIAHEKICYAYRYRRTRSSHLRRRHLCRRNRRCTRCRVDRLPVVGRRGRARCEDRSANDVRPGLRRFPCTDPSALHSVSG
jgi:hypothetical protein